MEDPAVTLFREYLRINTVQPKPDYDAINEFHIRIAKELGLPYQIIKVNDEPKREVFVMTLKGTDPSLPSVLLNSHTDVVPVFPECWKHPPFEAEKEDNGDIYARGSQDMKCVGIWYIEALRRLLKDNIAFKRTIHVSYVPDEEIGGKLGMGLFVKTKEFKDLNVGFALDEGLANPTNNFTIFHGERSVWWIYVRCTGNPGHGSRFIEGTAAGKLRKIIDTFLDFRSQEEKKYKSDCCMKLGDVITTNLTMIEGGIQHNVVPNEFKVGFDLRVPPSVNLKKLEDQIAQWCKDAGEGVTYEFIQKGECQVVTSIAKDDPWWKAFKTACDGLKMTLEPEIFPAGTDSRYLRELGIPALGFSAMNNTPILLHDHNEFLNEKIFLKGIDIYCSIIPAVANVPPV